VDPEPHFSEKAGYGSALKSKFKSLLEAKIELWRAVEAWRITMKAWRLTMEEYCKG
jgi:hypothetical protein